MILGRIPTALLARDRERFAAAFPDTAEILRISRESDGAGGRKKANGTNPAVIATVGARFQKSVGGGSDLTANESEGAAAVRAVADMAVLLPYDTDLRDTDRIRRTGTGETFEVVSSDKGASDALCLSVKLKRAGGR